MIRLGLFTVFTGLATAGTLYLIRIFISEKLGVDGVGQFQAAWNLSATYVGLVLGAMGADYFPRLSAINHDDEQVCRLVNEQTEIALLLAGPIIIGMICFMDVIVSLFYTAKFGQSIDILLWQMMGNLLKVISWPMGFVLLAKNKGSWFIFTELLWNTIFYGVILIVWSEHGLESAGIGFAFCYLLFTPTIFLICKKLCNFRWSHKNKLIVILFSLLTIVSFIVAKYQPVPFWRIISIALLFLSMAYSYRELRKIIDPRLMVKKFVSKFSLPSFHQSSK